MTTETGTTITANPNGWITIRVGELEIIVPATLDDGADERAEIRCNGFRVFVESHNDGPLVSAMERCS